MGSGAVKTIVMLMVLVVLSVLVGAQVSDSMKDSMGAFALIGIVGVAFGMLWMGSRSWQLLYFLPAFLTNAPIGGGTAGLSYTPLGFAAAFVVLGYGIIMWGMGYTKFHWRPYVVLDLLILGVFILFACSFIRFPVSISIVDADAEYVGGKEYIWLIGALLYYIAVSSMSGKPNEVVPLMKFTLYALIAGQLLYIVYGGLRLVGRASSDGLRYEFFNVLGAIIIFFVYSSAACLKLLASPKKLILLCFALAGILLGGRREVLVNTAMALIYVALLKKELLMCFILGCLAYGGLFVLGEQHVLEKAPFSVQRVAAVLPGIQVSRGVRSSNAGSSETRLMVWQLGMDPRSGYIKDYIFGDGFQTSSAFIRRGQTAAMRGTLDASAWGFARGLAASGNWHNGFLTIVHRLGLIGLVFLNLVFICGLVMLAKVSNAYRERSEYPYIMALILPFAQTALSFSWGTVTLLHYFASFQALGIIKVLYCCAREEKLLRPLFLREQYVPMTIRDIENAA